MTLRYKRNKTPRRRKKRAGNCPEHRKWIRDNYACLVEDCGTYAVDPHHESSIKIIPADEKTYIGGKCHDRWCVPLCRMHHNERHDQGFDSFSEKYGVDFEEAALMLQDRTPFKEKLGIK